VPFSKYTSLYITVLGITLSATSVGDPSGVRNAYAGPECLRTTVNKQKGSISYFFASSTRIPSRHRVVTAFFGRQNF
jgi:hypothetical protein